MTSDKFNCPTCGSSETRSFRAIAEAGTASGRGTGSISEFGRLAQNVSMDLQMASDEARIAQRPEYKYPWQSGVGGGFFGTAVLTFVLARVFPEFSKALNLPDIFEFYIATIVFGALFSIWGNFEEKQLNSDLQSRIQLWEKTWRCNRCANSFEVEG